MQRITVHARPIPRSLYLRKVEGVLWLRGYVCDAAYRWLGDDLFAFEL